MAATEWSTFAGFLSSTEPNFYMNYSSRAVKPNIDHSNKAVNVSLKVVATKVICSYYIIFYE